MQVDDKIQVIIADDHAYYIEGLKLLLSEAKKYVVLEDHQNGLDLVNSSQIYLANIILIDIDMPKMNGLEAAREIDFKYPHIPLIAITMHENDIFLKDIIAAGFNGFVYKPQASEKLLNVMNEVLDKKFAFPEYLKIQ